VGCGKLFGKKDDATIDAGATTTAASAAKPAAPGACSLGVPGGAVATGLDGDLDRFSIGATPDGAMLSMDLGVKKKDPLEDDKEKIFWFSRRAFVPSYVGSDVEKGVKFVLAPASISGEDGLQESAGSAFAMGDQAYSATFGQGERLDFKTTNQKFAYVMGAHQGPIWVSASRTQTNPTQLASAGRQGFAIVTSVAKLLDRHRDSQDQEPKTIGRVVEAVILDGKTVHVNEVARSLAPKEYPDAPAAAVSATHAAIAWKTTDKVMLALIGADGKPTGAVHEVSNGDVGAPALAFKNETLYAVWGERPSGSTSDYVMHYVAWDTSTAAPPAKKSIAGTGSAFAPGLASTGAALVLAWMEGDEHSGVVKLGSTAGASLEDVVKNVQSISTANVNARDPELGFAGEKGMIGWTEFPKNKPKGELRVSNLTCPSH
jgi:hypothetical protein